MQLFGGARAIGARIAGVSRLSPAANALALFVVMTACAAVLLFLPRGVVWQETPSLVLPPELVNAALAAEAKLADAVPHTEAAKSADGFWLELGHEEREGVPIHVRATRQRTMTMAIQRLTKESGEQAVLALRAAAAERLEAALDLKLDPKLASDVLGDFATMLEGESCSRNGELIAPRFVARTLYKARWNIAHGLPPAYAFAPIERRAYYGWQALHARRLPIQQRARALVEYARAGGTRTAEASGVLLVRNQQYAEALQAFAEAYRRAGTLRLRNAALGQASEE
jgi:hypothetical protein